jgi:hypothetical protein
VSGISSPAQALGVESTSARMARSCQVGNFWSRGEPLTDVQPLLPFRLNVYHS